MSNQRTTEFPSYIRFPSVEGRSESRTTAVRVAKTTENTEPWRGISAQAGPWIQFSYTNVSKKTIQVVTMSPRLGALPDDLWFELKRSLFAVPIRFDLSIRDHSLIDSRCASLLEGSLDLSLMFTFGDPLAFFVETSTSTDADLELGQPAGEVEPERDEGEAFLGEGLLELHDLASVEQQLAVPGGLVIGLSGGFVAGDVRADEEELTVVRSTVGLLD